jgi:hypothetical protein
MLDDVVAGAESGLRVRSQTGSWRNAHDAPARRPDQPCNKRSFLKMLDQLTNGLPVC